MRTLITGDTGFVGGHLISHLKKEGHKIFGLQRDFKADIRDASKLATVLKKVKPERIYHLAALASVAESWNKPKLTFDVNIGGSLNLFNAVHAHSPRARILAVGSAEEYGKSAEKMDRVKEDDAIRPVNPYAVSKAAQSMLAHQFFVSHGLHIVRTRAFNHIGPGQSPLYVSSSFARQVALIEKGAQKPIIEVGYLEALRDFTDVRDVVRAYALVLEKGKSGHVYNVCQGKARPVRQILEFYLSQSSATIAVKQNASRVRPADLSRLVGDPSRLRAQTGWKPRITFEQTLKDILNYWRQHIGQ